MSSTAQMAANLINAHASTGPRTTEGKAVSSQNAVSHGLTGGFRVLPHENQAEFDTCLAGYRDEFKPATEHERFLVELMTQSRWELQRTNRLMACVLERLSGADPASPDGAIAAALIARSADAWTILKRYAASAERTYLRCSRELTQHRNRRAKEASEIQHAKLCARLTDCYRPRALPHVRNEANRPGANDRRPRKPIPGVPFTDKDPLSWRL
jgi:hypothetical protein